MMTTINALTMRLSVCRKRIMDGLQPSERGQAWPDEWQRECCSIRGACLCAILAECDSAIIDDGLLRPAREGLPHRSAKRSQRTTGIPRLRDARRRNLVPSVPYSLSFLTASSTLRRPCNRGDSKPADTGTHSRNSSRSAGHSRKVRDGRGWAAGIQPLSQSRRFLRAHRVHRERRSGGM